MALLILWPTLAHSPKLVLMAEQEFEGRCRNMQTFLKASPCIWFAGVSLAKVTESVWEGPAWGGTQGGSES